MKKMRALKLLLVLVFCVVVPLSAQSAGTQIPLKIRQENISPSLGMCHGEGWVNPTSWSNNFSFLVGFDHFTNSDGTPDIVRYIAMYTHPETGDDYWMRTLFDYWQGGIDLSASYTGWGVGSGGLWDSQVIQNVLAERVYVEVKTDSYPNGAIRGYLQPIPEPGTMALLVGALPCFLLRRRIAHKI